MEPLITLPAIELNSSDRPPDLSQPLPGNREATPSSGAIPVTDLSNTSASLNVTGMAVDPSPEETAPPHQTPARPHPTPAP
ncbi:unnamed protein product [Linum trigynum]|uniref:Uncharacterized protein n=1 Tax=Linum trigynum TaxID=586398 RepID=A0AAV2DN53_9ROSI